MLFADSWRLTRSHVLQLLLLPQVVILSGSEESKKQKVMSGWIIGILFFLLPVAFQAIGKKLEKAGETEGPGGPENPESGPITDWTEVIRRHLEQQQEVFGRVEPEPVPEPMPEPVPDYKPVQKPVEKEVRRPVEIPKVMSAKAEEPIKSGEKIDPKKLVVYSEIMKPKYTEY